MVNAEMVAIRLENFLPQEACLRQSIDLFELRRYGGPSTRSRAAIRAKHADREGEMVFGSLKGFLG
jgi:hypothetical protein